MRKPTATPILAATIIALGACGNGETTTVTEKVMMEEPTGEDALIEEPTQEDLMMADSMAEEDTSPEEETAATPPPDNVPPPDRRTAASDVSASPSGSPYRPLPGDPNVEEAERRLGKETPTKPSGPPPEIR